MFKILLPLLFLIVFSVSCQTIHYTNKSEVPVGGYSYSQWHHIGVLGFVEFSSPVNVKAACGDKGWKAARTQKNILQGLMAMSISVIALYIYPGLGAVNLIYTPEEASVACS